MGNIAFPPLGLTTMGKISKEAFYVINIKVYFYDNFYRIRHSSEAAIFSLILNLFFFKPSQHLYVTPGLELLQITSCICKVNAI